MAACAISAAYGQPTAPPPVQAPPPPQALGEPQAPGGWPVGDAVREQVEAARRAAQADREIGAVAREATRAAEQAVRDQAKVLSLDFTRDAIRGVEDRVWSVVDEAALGQFDTAKMKMLMAQDFTPKASMAPMPMPARGPKGFMFDSGSGSNESGKNALDNHNYEKAVEIFDRVINARTPSTRADGAHYWKAYALNKLGKRDEALATLAELSSKFAQSSWLNDANALKAEVQQGKGQAISPENQADEDLKLYAINALINSDADRAVPLLEGLLSNPKMSPRLKERALFVLAQSRSDKAHDIVGHYAKGGSNPDLQLTAVQYLGTYRSKESRQLLSEVYTSVNDVNVKRAVLRSFEMSRDIEKEHFDSHREERTERGSAARGDPAAGQYSRRSDGEPGGDLRRTESDKEHARARF